MSIVDKFPKSWENFGMTLKHQKGRLSLDDLMIAISIEEEHRNQTHKMPVEHQPKANLIVGKQRVNKINSNSKAINKGKTTKNKKPKANKPCWNSGQVGHWAKLCPNKKAKTGQTVVNMVVEVLAASTSGATEGPSLEGWKPSLKYFRVRGCLAKVLVQEHKRKKLGPKTVDAVFLGYVETSYALRFLVIKSKISGIEVNTIVKFRDAVFLEDVFPMKIGTPSSVSLNDSLTSTSIPEHLEKMTNVGVNPNSTNLTHEESDIWNVMASSKAKQWKEAVKSEMDSIVSNRTWMLVDLPPGCTTIGCLRLLRAGLDQLGSWTGSEGRTAALLGCRALSRRYRAAGLRSWTTSVVGWSLALEVG
ncbi:hypothetical protein Sango_2959500 [Sesamum angolense]|uniref:Retroviral polymerase SH3-like domain-containing protein n=1 Tax=Sesamum angolense TaxID=2727404 RepID=A0AAE1T483_9LAMI|nr:hypothetical protein Sango_2959500 [Sesamum angolense]